MARTTTQTSAHIGKRERPRKKHRRLRTPPRRMVPPKNHQSILRSVKIGGMTLTMVVWCSTKLWWRPQRQKNFENGKIQACAKPVRRAYQPNLGPPGQSDHRQRVFKKASTEEYKEIRQGSGNILHGGKITTNPKGYHPGYGIVWSHPGSIANILSLSKVAEKYRVSYDITSENIFLVYLPMG